MAAASASASTSVRPRTFAICGNNGVKLIENALTARGWTRVDPASPDFCLRWVEIKRDLDFTRFRPGKQLLCRNPGVGVLASKVRLLEALRQHNARQERAVRGGAGARAAAAIPATSQPAPAGETVLGTFFPETFKLDDARERRAFFDAAARLPAGTIWICKPTGMNQGKGIYLVEDLTVFRRQLDAEAAAVRRPG